MTNDPISTPEYVTDIILIGGALLMVGGRREEVVNAVEGAGYRQFSTLTIRTVEGPWIKIDLNPDQVLLIGAERPWVEPAVPVVPKDDLVPAVGMGSLEEALASIA